MKTERYNGVTRIIDIGDELDLRKTLNCGQAFRWQEIDNTGIFNGVIGNKVVFIRQGLFNDKKEGIATNLDIKDIDILVNYLNLNLSYKKIFECELDLKSDAFAYKSYQYSKGIRIVKQNLWEMIISFIISQQNNISRISKTIDKISEKYGDKIIGSWFGHEIIRYTFTTPEQLSKATYDDLRELGLGFRDKYIIGATNKIITDTTFLDRVTKSNNPEYLLTELYGVGPKVASCVTLFGLNKYDSFPIDRHIQRIISEEYDGNIDLTKFKGYAGIVQQFMFYYRLNN